jgi:hypothetical protein
MVFKTPSVATKQQQDNECPSTQFIEPGAYYPSSFVPQDVAAAPIGRYGAFYPKTTSKVLGICLVFMSWLSVAGAMLALMFYAAAAWLATGFWCGAFYSIAGIISINAGRSPIDKMVTGTAISSMFAAAFGVTQLGIACIGLEYDVTCYCSNTCNTTPTVGGIASNSIMAFASLSSVICGIWLLVVATRAVRRGSRHQVIVAQPILHSPNMQTAQVQPCVTPLQASTLYTDQQVSLGGLQQCEVTVAQPILSSSKLQTGSFQPSATSLQQQAASASYADQRASERGLQPC